MKPLRGDTIPILPARDIPETVEFYGRLGVAGVGLITDTPWSMRECAVVDPSGNLLRIGTPSGT